MRRSADAVDDINNDEVAMTSGRRGFTSGAEEDPQSRGRLNNGSAVPREKKSMEGALELLGLLRLLGEAYRHLCMYRCQVRVFINMQNGQIWSINGKFEARASLNIKEAITLGNFLSWACYARWT